MIDMTRPGRLLVMTPLGPMTLRQASIASGISRPVLARRVKSGTPYRNLFDSPTPNGIGLKRVKNAKH